MGRSPDPHGRVLLDFDHCPKDELGFALASVAQMAPRLHSLQGLVWDGAGRGAHASQLGRALGIQIISPITPGPRRPHHRQGRRLQASSGRHGER